MAFFPEGSGANTWSGDHCQGYYSYDFNLTGTQLAFGTYFDWSVSCSIPVLAIMDCGSIDPAPGDVCTGIGTPMQTGPFPGQAPAFNGVVSQPIGNVPNITLNGLSYINLQLDDQYTDAGANAAADADTQPPPDQT